MSLSAAPQSVDSSALAGLGRVLPLYVMGDVSSSMTGASLDQVNQLMAPLMTTIHTNGMLHDTVYLCVADFSSQANMLLPLCRVGDAPGVPQFAGGGSTSYAAAFDLLAGAIARDVPALKAAGKQVIRPAVFFYSDGQPTDDEAVWKAAFSRLADPAPGRVHANVIPFGIGNADPAVIRHISRPQGYHQDVHAGYDLSAAMKTIIEAIMRSLVSSATSLHQGGGLLLPNQVPGFTVVPGDVV